MITAQIKLASRGAIGLQRCNYCIFLQQCCTINFASRIPVFFLNVKKNIFIIMNSLHHQHQHDNSTEQTDFVS